MLLILLSSVFLNAEFVSVDCGAFNQVYAELQGIGKKCEVSSDIHTFKQSVDKNISGIIQYENGEEVPINVVNNLLSINIEQDRKFTINFGDMKSVPLKLSILSNGSESWKYLKYTTKRWNKYTFNKIFLETFLTQNYYLYEDGSIPKNVKVQIIAGLFVFEGETDASGHILLPVSINTPFMVRSWNSKINDWSTSTHQFKIVDSKYYEDINNTWVENNKVWN